MNAKEAHQLALVLMAFANGRTCQALHRTSVNDIWWDINGKHKWNPSRYHYRIKPHGTS